MSVQTRTHPAPVSTAAALAFIAGASILRVAVSGSHVAASLFGAVIFSAVLLSAALLWHISPALPKVRSLGIGALGAAVLVVLPHIHSAMPLRIAAPTPTLLAWSLIVTLVACSEEFALRGMLFNAVTSARGPVAAVVVTSVIFAFMHVPLYGWQALPLDLAVGALLGVLRYYGGVTASATAHTLADLAAGWLL